MKEFVKWTVSNQYTTGHGEMPIENIKSCLADFRNAAIKYQEETDAQLAALEEKIDEILNKGKEEMSYED